VVPSPFSSIQRGSKQTSHAGGRFVSSCVLISLVPFTRTPNGFTTTKPPPPFFLQRFSYPLFLRAWLFYFPSPPHFFFPYQSPSRFLFWTRSQAGYRFNVLKNFVRHQSSAWQSRHPYFSFFPCSLFEGLLHLLLSKSPSFA